MRLAIFLLCSVVAFGQTTLPPPAPKADPLEYVRLSEILIAPKIAVPVDSQAGANPDAPSSSAHNTQPAVDGAAPQAGEATALAAAQAKANDLLKQIRNGASFEDIAKKYSDGPTAAQGGAVGAFKRGKLSREIEDKVFAMKVGEVSDVIRTKQGFIILQVKGQGTALGTKRGSPVEVLSDTLGVDFGPYIAHIKTQIYEHWYDVLPTSVYPPVSRKGKVLIRFSIMKDGRVNGMALVTTSGDTMLDRAALDGIAGSAPFPSLPDEFIKAGGTDLTVQGWFFYNPDNGDAGHNE